MYSRSPASNINSSNTCLGLPGANSSYIFHLTLPSVWNKKFSVSSAWAGKDFELAAGET